MYCWHHHCLPIPSLTLQWHMICPQTAIIQSKGQTESAHHITAMRGPRATELVMDLLDLSLEETASELQEKCPSGPSIFHADQSRKVGVPNDSVGKGSQQNACPSSCYQVQRDRKSNSLRSDFGK